MTDDPGAGSSLDAGATEAAVELLSNPTRLRIVDALGKRQTESPHSPAVGFAELQRLVDAEDSGNFAYHLDRLRESLVDRTDDGYRLTDAGSQVSSLLHSSLLHPNDPIEIETEYECGACGASIVARTTDVCIEFHCGSGHGFRTSGVPDSVLEASVDRALGLALRQVYDDLETIAAGYCPRCHHPMTWATETVGEDLRSHLLRAQCTACAMVCGSPVTTWALADWDVRARLHVAEVDLRETPLWEVRNLPTSVPERVVGDDDTPPEQTRYRLRFDVGETAFTVEIDGTATVRSVESE